MKRLWAPWRMEYINSGENPGCIFCDKPEEDEDKKNLILHKGSLSFIMLNAFPYNNGHLMIAPYRHVADIAALTDEETLDMMKLVSLGKETLAQAFCPDGYNVGINLGRVAGAGIADHIHIHIVPRWNGDTNFMPVTADTKVMPQALESTFLKLSETMSKALDK